jgi:DNA-binding response OmpR family regulator
MTYVILRHSKLCKLNYKQLKNMNMPKKPTNQDSTIFVLDNIIFDAPNDRFIEDKHEVHLTKTEYFILRYFFEHPEKLITREKLINHIYSKHDNPQSNVIERHIRSIRSKFTSDPIRTVRGLGYRLNKEPNI